jgi:preprotein translocase subunit SecA
MLAEPPRHDELPKNLDAAWNSALGWADRLRRRRATCLHRAERVERLEPEIKDLSDARLREQALALRDRFRRRRETAADLERAFAVIREVAVRKLGERPFRVQIAGAFAMEAGCIAEMATGEGKTLTATLPATVAGWRGRGCHVITVNDYLAKRDAEWMNRIYEFCGLHVAHIVQEMEPPDRRAAYHADITYCTNKEVTADFLRDRLALGRLRGLPQALLMKIARGQGAGTDRLVQRGLHYAIIDEADSVLIDEAVTPLIISGDAPNEEQVEAFQQAAELAAGLEERRDYRVDVRHREITFTRAGKDRLAALAEPIGGIWAGARRREELVNQALTARQFYLLDKQYVVSEEEAEDDEDEGGAKVVIVDEFTGRLMPDRTWRDGLHQAIEAKEGLTVNPPKDTYARVSFQRFFRMYRTLSGMTGTAAEAWKEFWQIYRRPVVVIPTNRPCIRTLEPDRVYATEDAKWAAIVAEIERVHATGRPVLVGTRSVRASEHLGRLLERNGLDHQVLNAVRHAEEAQIIAAAGQEGKVTVATNMAGRGVNIRLGAGIVEKGGLHVIASERHESGRIDRQLFGRAARQGEPGSGVAIVSLEDELVARHAARRSQLLRRRYGRTDADISSWITRKAFNVAQRRAERLALRQRKGVLRTDDWLDEYLGFAGKEG